MLLFIRLIKNNNNNNRPINRVLKSLFAALSGTSASSQVGRIYTNTKEKYKRRQQKNKNKLKTCTGVQSQCGRLSPGTVGTQVVHLVGQEAWLDCVGLGFHSPGCSEQLHTDVSPVPYGPTLFAT